MRADARLTAAVAVFLVVSLHAAGTRLNAEAARARTAAASLDAAASGVEEALDGARVLRDLKARDLASFKAGLARLTGSRRALYEAGLELQDEKRQLEKLWEVLTTYLLVDAAQ